MMTLKINIISGVLFTASLLVSSNLLAQWGSTWGGNNNGDTDPAGYGRPPMPYYDSTSGAGIPGPAQGAGPTNPVGYGRPPMPYYGPTNRPQYGGQNGARSAKGWPISQGGN